MVHKTLTGEGRPKYHSSVTLNAGCSSFGGFCKGSHQPPASESPGMLCPPLCSTSDLLHCVDATYRGSPRDSHTLILQKGNRSTEMTRVPSGDKTGSSDSPSSTSHCLKVSFQMPPKMALRQFHSPSGHACHRQSPLTVSGK